MLKKRNCVNKIEGRIIFWKGNLILNHKYFLNETISKKKLKIRLTILTTRDAYLWDMVLRKERVA